MNDSLKTKAELIKELESLRNSIEEKSLMEELTHRQILFEQSPDGVLIIDPKTAGFIEFNASAHQQLGYTREEFSKLTRWDIEVPETDSETIKMMAGGLPNGRADFETIQRTKQGDLRTVHVTVQTIDVKGDLVFYCVWRDISNRRRAEDALQKSEEKYRTLSLIKNAILESPEGIIVFALDKNYCYLDFTSIHQQTMQIIWGVTIERGGNMLTYIKSAADREKAKANFDRALQGERFLAEEEYGDEELKRSFYEDRYGPVFDDKNDIIGVSVFVIDITERKQAEKALEKTNIDLQLAQRIANIGNWLLDPEIGVPEWSEEVYRIYEREPGLGPHPLSDYKKLYDGANWNRFHSAIQGAINQGLPYDIELKLELPSGKVKWINAICEPEPEKGPQGHFLRGTIQDISERKQAEESLRNSEERLQLVIKGSNDAPWDWDFARQKIYYSPQWWAQIGYEPDELPVTDQLWYELTHPDDRKTVNATLDEAQKTDMASYQIEFRLQHKQGHFVPVLSRGLISRDEGDNILRVTGTNMDLTESKLMQAKLAENEAKFRNSFEAAHVGMAIVNAQGEFISVNRSVTRILDYSEDEFLSMSFIDITHPEDLESSIEKYQRCLKDHQSYTIEKRYISKIGIIKWGLLTISPIFGSDNELIYSIAHLQDISERTKAEEAVQESEERFNLAMQASNDGLFDWNLETNEIYYSPGWKRMLGYQDHELANDFTVWEKATEPEDVKRSWELQEKLIKRQIDRFVMEFKMKHKDGHWIDILSRAEAFFDEAGKAIRIIGTHTDITYRKKAEEELAQSERDYRGLFDMAHDTIILFEEKDEIVVEANQHACELYGYSREEFIGMSLANISTDVGMGRSRVKEVFEKGHIKQFETIQKCKDGSRIIVEVNASRTNYQGKSVILSLNHDITDRKQAEKERIALEAQLRQAQRLEAIGTMVGGISHEFNNVLQSMFLYSGLVQDKLPDDEELRSNFQHILNDGNRARDLIKQILTFSRESKVEMKPQPLHEMIMEVLALERASLSANIEIQQDIDLNCGSVLSDKTQIHQILINLCNNAQHAMEDKGGTLTVRLKQMRTSMNDNDFETDVLELMVSDTGHGIDASDLEKIFDPFFTTKEFGKGTGLGLSVIHGIVEMMEGQISVSSKYGKGTTFRILFPVTEAVQAEDPFKSTGNEDVISRSILLVDDEESIRSVMKIVLTRKGFKVDSAADGQQALELFKANPGKYELIVTDKSMPKMSGVELTKAIRKIQSDIPIILSTGQLGIEDEKESNNIGITAFIQKPWKAEELIERIQELDSK